jgi:hypothetical protein
MNGTVTAAGSKILADNRTDFDSAVVERLKAAGAVIVGKTKMSICSGIALLLPGGFQDFPCSATCSRVVPISKVNARLNGFEQAFAGANSPDDRPRYLLGVTSEGNSPIVARAGTFETSSGVRHLDRCWRCPIPESMLQTTCAPQRCALYPICAGNPSWEDRR